MSLFTACNNDDKEVFPVDEELVGVYKGAMDIVLDEMPIANQLPKNVNISKAGDNQIKMELKDFTFAGMNIGTITIDRCDLNRSGDVYSFTGSQTLTLLAPLGNCPVTVNGTIGKGRLEMDIDVDVRSLSQSVQVAYSGDKLNGNESAEAKIITFVIDNTFVLEQPTINEEQGTITFKVNETATADDLRAMIPTFTISDKAIVTPASGVAQDFSGGKVVTYTVVAENGTVKEYKASISGNMSILKYSFDEWAEAGGYTVKYQTPLPLTELASSNAGAELLVAFGFKGGFPVLQEADAKKGNYAAKLVTLYTQGEGFGMAPVVTAGSLFTGAFSLNISDQLASTKFGVSYNKKPVRFKGWYKYTAGTPFYNGSNDAIIDKIDECSIAAILYTVNADDEFLTGHDINTSDKIVAKAVLQDGTAKADYTEFNIPFTFVEGKTYEAGAKYKMAIVCSSSKEGDK
ncbi:MAG: PCMD domain-containing protein, partial [Bacteroides sp.]|nr:PCMD domain-containing protein [Bacteroides sp.]